MKKTFLPAREDMRALAGDLAAAIDPDFLAYGEKPVTVALVGKQHVGKSSVMEAIRDGLGTAVEEDEDLGSISRQTWFVNTADDSCQVISVDRAMEQAWEPQESDYARTRIMGGIDIIQHPTADDLAAASLVITLHPFDPASCPEGYGETKAALAGLRAKFGEPAGTPTDVYDTGMRVMEIEARDPRLLGSQRFQDFYAALPAIYTRPPPESAQSSPSQALSP